MCVVVFIDIVYKLQSEYLKINKQHIYISVQTNFQIITCRLHYYKKTY